MRIRQDDEHDGGFWIDQGVDGRADHFTPCPTCQASLGSRMGWQTVDLCPACGSRLEIESAVAGVTDDRPLICTTDPNRRALDGSLIPIWGSAATDPADVCDQEYPIPGSDEHIP